MASSCRGSPPGTTSIERSRQTSRKPGLPFDGGGSRSRRFCQTASRSDCTATCSATSGDGPASTERNIGIAPWDVAVSVRDLMADASLWTTGDNPMEADEAAVRLHHRLVWIHPFANGNGRHSREMADVLVRCLGQPAFTWGSRRLVDPSDTRQQYLTALRAADRGNYEPLVRFVRT